VRPVKLNLRKRWRNWLQAMLAGSLLGYAAVVAAESATEPVVRTALLFNFLKFTEWPAEASDATHLHVCIASSDPELIAAMETINARQVQGKAVLIMGFRQQADCEVIYVDSRQRWNSIREKPGQAHALTIGGYAGFVTDGGMIEIILQQGGSRFDINLGEAKRAGLRFYPQLLKLARRIVE
jgi:YfiR/HmsC-like